MQRQKLFNTNHFLRKARPTGASAATPSITPFVAASYELPPIGVQRECVSALRYAAVINGKTQDHREVECGCAKWKKSKLKMSAC
jgi:hypothetical protein